MCLIVGAEQYDLPGYQGIGTSFGPKQSKHLRLMLKHRTRTLRTFKFRSIRQTTIIKNINNAFANGFTEFNYPVSTLSTVDFSA